MLLVLIGIGCNKTQSLEETSIPKVVLKTTNSNVEDLLRSNARDREEEAINRKHLDLALVLKSLSTDKEFVRTVLTIAKENKGTVQLDKLFANLPRVKPQFDAALAKKVTSNISARTVETITYEGYIYDLVIFVPNYEVALDDEYAIVSPGFVEYDDIENDNPDIIFAWQTAPNGVSAQVLVGEKEAMAIPQPVMLPGLETIGNTFSLDEMAQFRKINKAKADELKKELEKRSEMSNLDAIGLRTDAHIDIDQVRIHPNYGYETSKHSEFTIDAYRVDKSFVTGNGFTKNIKLDKVQGSWHVKYVHFSELGTTLSITSRFADFMPTTNIASTLLNNRAYIFNTYERDWYNTNKSLGTGTIWGVTLNPSGRRKFQHEWYSFVPDGDLEIFPIAAAAYVWGNATVTFAYPENAPSQPEKGKMRFSFVN